MRKIIDDQEAIKLIDFLNHGGPNTEEEWDEIENRLEDFQMGISNVMREQKCIYSPEEILRIARLKNKQIIL